MGRGRILGAGLIVMAAVASSVGMSGMGSVQADHEGFAFAGAPIHPKLVEEFEGWLSDDQPPITVAVDVAAASGTNEYAEPVETTEAGLVRYAAGEGWFGYSHLGRMNDGTHVLRTASNGGGTGIFTNLLFVRLDADEVRAPSGASRRRVLMRVVGRFVLGDRDDGTVEVEGDRVVVSASRYRAAPTVLDFGR